MRTSITRTAAVGFAAIAVAVGIAAPALAAGSRTSHMTNWIDGDASSNWSVGTNASTHVTFNSCNREFKATIRHTIPLHADPAVGSEWINCKSYADAVYATADGGGNYHFDVTGMGIAYCVAGACVFNTTTVPSMVIHW